MKDMVLVDLYTDGNDAASQANQALENGEFHTIAIPFYVHLRRRQESGGDIPLPDARSGKVSGFP